MALRLYSPTYGARIDLGPLYRAGDTVETLLERADVGDAQLELSVS